jgi:hypothetical protein
MAALVEPVLAIIVSHWKTIAGVAISIFFILLLWKFPKCQVRSIAPMNAKERFDRENEARKTLSQILGGLILLIGFYFTWQNLVATQESQITDRFTKAIAQLGDKDHLELRLGAIYSLERIAKDSSRDHWPIMEVLTAYVREHAKIGPEDKQLSDTATQPPPDIQAILTVIGRRSFSYHNGEAGPLELRKTNLRGADLWTANLSWAHLEDADLRGAHLGWVNLSGARLRGTKLNGADLFNTDLSQAELCGADLKEAKRLKYEQLESAKGDASTKLPLGILRPKSWPDTTSSCE